MSERLKARQTPVENTVFRPAPVQRLPERVNEECRYGIALDALVSRIHNLPRLSVAAVRALQLMNSDIASARNIVEVINRDPVFARRVVKTVNARCDGWSRTVSSVNEAILLLGVEAFREIVVVTAAKDIFCRDMEGYGLSAAEFWNEALACGRAAEMIAERTGYSNPTDAFVAGLLHDIGKVTLNEEMRTAHAVVLEHMQTENCALIDSERAVLGFDHCDVGGRVLRHWRLPAHIVQAVALHGKPVVSRQTVPLAGYVHLAEILCSMAGIGVGCKGLALTLDTRVLLDFKLAQHDVELILARLIDTLSASEPVSVPPRRTMD